jgi:hypothetical protein
MLAIVAGGSVGLGALYYTIVISDAGLSFAAARVGGGLAFSLGLALCWEAPSSTDVRPFSNCFPLFQIAQMGGCLFRTFVDVRGHRALRCRARTATKSRGDRGYPARNMSAGRRTWPQSGDRDSRSSEIHMERSSSQVALRHILKA